VHIELTVSSRERGWRLDQYVTEKGPPWLSRSQVKKIITEGKVRVNKAIRKPAHRIKLGDTISFDIPSSPAKADIPRREDIPLSILFEDSDIIVVDKPAGMIVHPVPRRKSGTLVNALLAHCETFHKMSSMERPGIVHRLDKETSGVMVVAKTETAHTSLSQQFKAREVTKTYLAIVKGKVPLDGVIDVPIARHPVNRLKMKIDPVGKPARTLFRRLRSFGNSASVVLVRTETGRTHQIRVHFKHIGSPLLGDRLYGNARQDEAFDVKRQMLHAMKLCFTHPSTRNRVCILSRIPEDMKVVLSNLTDLERKGT